MSQTDTCKGCYRAYIYQQLTCANAIFVVVVSTDLLEECFKLWNEASNNCLVEGGCHLSSLVVVIDSCNDGIDGNYRPSRNQVSDQVLCDVVNSSSHSRELDVFIWNKWTIKSIDHQLQAQQSDVRQVQGLGCGIESPSR